MSFPKDVFDDLEANPQSDIAIVGSSLQIIDPPTTSPGEDGEQELLEPYAKFRTAPFNALQELGLHVLGTAWRSYDRVIGQEIFYPGFSERMKEMVLNQTMLRSKISELAKKRVDAEMEKQGTMVKRDRRRKEIEEQLLSVADDWTDKMICKMESRRFIRGAYYLATQLLTRAYHQGIHVSSQEVLALREVAKEAAAKKQSLIFLPCHRSHVDYVSLQLVCYRLGLALPTVVAGDNLNFPLVGSFLQHAGAFYIRRSFGDDQMYTSLVQSYIDTLLQNGYNIECFVEGGRSRTGKLLQPKFGILSFILDSILSGRVQDAIICAVSTQYDKVIEVDSYVSELLGQPKKKEDLASFLSASNVLSLKLGRIDVRFHKPWSLREFVNDHTSRFMAQRSPGDEALSASAVKRRLLTTLGYTILSEINEVSVVMPTALVGTVLLTLTGRSVGRAELVRRVRWLTDHVRAAGGRVAHFAGITVETVVDKALEVLGPQLVGRIEGLPEEMYYAEDRFQLSFYRNMTIHLFISQALVCTAMYTVVKLGGGANAEVISYQSLYDYVFFLSQLFRAEFIFPTTPLVENFATTLNGLVDDNVLSITRSPADATKISHVSIHPSERAADMENFDFYNFLLWPFIEASWLGAVALFMLAPPANHPRGEPAWLDMKTFADKAQLLGKTLFHRGDLSYYEAVNKEALKNALARSQEEGIIIVTRPAKDTKTPQRVRLDPAWAPPHHDPEGRILPRGRLWDFAEHISLSRKDAGERKDGVTVATRILGLAKVVGEELWETAVLDAQAEPVAASGADKKKNFGVKRRRGIQTGAKARL